MDKNKLKEYTRRIISKCRAGDTDSFEWIIETYQDDLRAMLMFASSSARMAEEILQKTFVDAYLHLSQFDPDRSFSAWIRAIARNNLTDEHRRLIKEKKHHPLLASVMEEEIHQTENDDAKDNKITAIKECVSNLKEDSRRMIAMRYRSGSSFQEIARTIGKKIGAVKMALTRIKKVLKNCIEKKLSGQVEL